MASLLLSLCAPKSDRAAVFLSSAAPPPSLAGCGTSASRRPLPPGRSLAGARPLQPAGPSSAVAEEGRCGRFDLPHRRFWSVELAEKAGRVHGGREREGQEGGSARDRREGAGRDSERGRPDIDAEGGEQYPELDREETRMAMLLDNDFHLYREADSDAELFFSSVGDALRNY